MFIPNVNATDILLDSYSESNRDDYNAVSSTFDARGQSFATPNDGISYKITSVKIYCQKNSATGSVYAYLYAHTGTYGTSSKPTGSYLASSIGYDSSTFPASYSLVEMVFNATNQYEMSPNTYYCLALIGAYMTGGSVGWGADYSSPTHSGNEFLTFDLSTWVSESPPDECFYVYGLSEDEEYSYILSETGSGFELNGFGLEAVDRSIETGSSSDFAGLGKEIQGQPFETSTITDLSLMGLSGLFNFGETSITGEISNMGVEVYGNFFYIVSQIGEVFSFVSYSFQTGLLGGVEYIAFIIAICALVLVLSSSRKS